MVRMVSSGENGENGENESDARSTPIKQSGPLDRLKIGLKSCPLTYKIKVKVTLRHIHCPRAPSSCMSMTVCNHVGSFQLSLNIHKPKKKKKKPSGEKKEDRF